MRERRRERERDSMNSNHHVPLLCTSIQVLLAVLGDRNTLTVLYLT